MAARLAAPLMSGVLSPGRLADLLVLGTDPWQVAVDALPDVLVDQVWIGGQAWHDRSQ